jgi:hypothetical protein
MASRVIPTIISLPRRVGGETGGLGEVWTGADGEDRSAEGLAHARRPGRRTPETRLDKAVFAEYVFVYSCYPDFIIRKYPYVSITWE